MQPRGGLSPDGRWLAYGINRSSRDNELRILSLADGTTNTIAFGTGAAFSDNSRWAAYSIGYSEARQERMRRERRPIHRKLGLMNLATGDAIVVDGIESFSLSPTGTHIAMRRAEDKAGNGVQLFDAATSRLTVLDSGSAAFTGLAWRRESADLAVLRAAVDPTRDGPTRTALAWKNLASGTPARHAYDPAADSRFPGGSRIVSFRRPAWSDDGETVFVGVAEWKVKPPAPARPASAPGRDASTPVTAPPPSPPSCPSVDVWHARDVQVMARQKVSARAERQRSLLAAWHLEPGTLVQIGQGRLENVVPIRRQKLALVHQFETYAMDRSIGRLAADLYLADTGTGSRAKLADGVNDFYVQASPGGRYILYFHADHYWTIDTGTRAVANVTKGVPASFVNRESDAAVRQKPPFGVAGWAKDDAAVVLYDKLDMWRIPSAGGPAARLTDGAPDQVRHRYIRLDPDDEWIDLDKPVPVSLFGVWTKQSGYGRLAPGGAKAERLVWMEAGGVVERPLKPLAAVVAILDDARPPP